MFLAAAVETFVTFAGVVLVGLTLKAARQSAHHTKRQAIAAERTLHELERPYLLAVGLGPIQKRQTERGTAHAIQLAIGNYRRTPAEFALARGKFIWSEYLTKESRDANNISGGNQFSEDNQSRPIGADKQISIEDFYLPSTIPIVHHEDGRYLPHTSGRERLFLWLVIEFDDMPGNRFAIHRCWRFDHVSGWVRAGRGDLNYETKTDAKDSR